MCIFKDFEVFSRALIASNDVDPTYPMVKSIISHYGFEPEWFVFMYVAFYSIDSGIKMCLEMPTKEDWDADKFISMRKSINKFGHERRGTARNPERQVEMLSAVAEFIEQLPNNPPKDNMSFRKDIESLPMHGSWAAFKIAELFEKSLDYNKLRISDLGLVGRDPNSNDGPVGGLRWLYGRDNKYDKAMLGHWDNFGIALAKAWGVDIGEVETCFCKFHKFCSGKYFIGHDIQEFVELEETMGSKAYKTIMSKHFDSSFWLNKTKLEKHNKKVYHDTGDILNSKYASNLPKIDVLSILLSTT